VLNPGALGHTSYALHDAIEAIAIPVVEVHISDIEAREPWRAESVIRPACIGALWGKGVEGYREALEMLARWSARSRRPRRVGGGRASCSR
jgi:3-dehydroquinate dehydratase-2